MEYGTFFERQDTSLTVTVKDGFQISRSNYVIFHISNLPTGGGPKGENPVSEERVKSVNRDYDILLPGQDPIRYADTTLHFANEFGGPALRYPSDYDDGLINIAIKAPWWFSDSEEPLQNLDLIVLEHILQDSMEIEGIKFLYLGGAPRPLSRLNGVQDFLKDQNFEMVGSNTHASHGIMHDLGKLINYFLKRV